MNFNKFYLCRRQAGGKFKKRSTNRTIRKCYAINTKYQGYRGQGCIISLYYTPLTEDNLKNCYNTLALIVLKSTKYLILIVL